MATDAQIDAVARRVGPIIRPTPKPTGPPPATPFPIHLTARLRQAIESGAQFSKDELSPQQFAEYEAIRPVPGMWLGREVQ